MVIFYNVLINSACFASSELLHPNSTSVSLISMVMHCNLMESVLQGVPLNACRFEPEERGLCSLSFLVIAHGFEQL